MQQPSRSISHRSAVLQQREHYESPPPDINLSTRARRRSRTTPAQVAILEDYFHNVTNKPSRDICRDELAPQVNISGDSVYFWFQNRRSKMSREQRRGRSESPPRRRSLRSSTSAITPSRSNGEDYTGDTTASRAPITREVSTQLQQLRLQRDDQQQRQPMTYYPSTSQTSHSPNAIVASSAESSSFSASSTVAPSNTRSSHHERNISSSSYGNTSITSGNPSPYMMSSQQQHTRLPPLSSFISSSTSNSGGASAAYSGAGSAFTPTAAASIDVPLSSDASSYRASGHHYQQSQQQQQRQGRESQESTMTTTSNMGPATTTTTFSTMATPVPVYNIRMPGTSEIPPIPFYFHHAEYGTEASMLHYLHNLEHQQQQRAEQHHQQEQQQKQSTPPSQTETPQ